jgi:hypothetical protein
MIGGLVSDSSNLLSSDVKSTLENSDTLSASAFDSFGKVNAFATFLDSAFGWIYFTLTSEIFSFYFNLKADLFFEPSSLSSLICIRPFLIFI